MSKLKINRNHIIILIIGLIVIILDQITKFLVVKNMDVATSLDLIPNFFSIFYIRNDGAALSSMRGQRIFLIIASLICIGFIINIIKKEEYKSRITTFSLGILIGGMFGNLIDRLFYKDVIDFLSFTLFGRHMPIFNIADICIVCGVIIYVALNLLQEKFKNN